MEKKILIDISFILKKYHTGVANYAYRFLQYILDHNLQDQCILLVNIAEKDHFAKVYPKFEQHTIGKMWMYKLRVFMWFAFAYDFKKTVNRLNADVLFCPWENPINALRVKKRKFTTIHDMQIRIDKDNFRKITVWMQKWVDNNSIRNSDKIITVSDFSRKQILSFYPNASGKVVNFSNSVSLAHTENNLPMDIGSPYLLYVGRLDVMKNVITLVKAFNLIKDKYTAYKLVLISSYWDYFETEIKPYVKNNDMMDRIVCVHNCSDEELTRWYMGASLFVFPSLREGFGYPPIEASFLKIPVVSSKSDSLEEVTLGLLNYYEPADNHNELSKTIDKCLSFPKSEKELDEIKNIMYDHYSTDTFGKKLFDFLIAQ